MDGTLTLAGGKSKWEKKCEVRQFLLFLKVGYLCVQATQATGLPRSFLKKVIYKISDTQLAFYCTISIETMLYDKEKPKINAKVREMTRGRLLGALPAKTLASPKNSPNLCLNG